MHDKLNGISQLSSLNNNRDITISVGWTERPSHHDIKHMNSQKSHLTGNFLIFLCLLKLNLMSPMEKCPNKGKINILYYVNRHFFCFETLNGTAIFMWMLIWT